MLRVTPAILTHDRTLFSEQVHRFTSSFDIVHVDFGEPPFISRPLIHPSALSEVEGMAVEAHVMAQNYALWIEQLLAYPTVMSIIVHRECCGDDVAWIDRIHDAGRLAGLALNPETDPRSCIAVVDLVDYVQLMTVHPGQQGGKFLPDVLGKVVALQHPGLSHIQVDGGIDVATIGDVVKSGISRVVVGHYFAEGDVDLAYQALVQKSQEYV
jgi:pentose-5-phosphate-3-epimerase